jgi:purine catabolism regulator
VDCRPLVALITIGPDPEGQAELEDRLRRQLRRAAVPAIVGDLSRGRIGVLLATTALASWRPVMQRISQHVHESYPAAVVSVGSEVSDISHAARSFQEAARVAEAAVPDGRPFYELSDIGLRELLYALRADLHVQDFAERQVGRLADYDNRHGTDLVATLHTYLDAAGNKTAAARQRAMSRQALYQRLRTIERLLDCNLESGRHRTRLHVALTAMDVLRSHGTTVSQLTCTLDRSV